MDHHPAGMRLLETADWTLIQLKSQLLEIASWTLVQLRSASLLQILTLVKTRLDPQS